MNRTNPSAEPEETLPRPEEVSEPKTEYIDVIGFSPFFGFFLEAAATDLGVLLGQTRLHRVLLNGETSERIAPVYPELQGWLDAKKIKALNELVFSRACNFPSMAEDCSRIRAINLIPQGRR